MVSVADVACANTHTVASAVLALEIANEFLLGMKRDGKNLVEKTSKRISGQMISLNTSSKRIQGSLEKEAGKLSAKFSKAKGGAERKGGKTRITLQLGDTVNVATVEDKLQQIEVNGG